MARSLILLAALAGAAVAAETTTIQVLFFGDNFSFAGSIVNADASATTIAAQCPSGTGSEKCGIPAEGLTVTQGPSTWQLDYSFFAESGTKLLTQKAHCKLDPAKDEAQCTAEDPSGMTGAAITTAVEQYLQSMIPMTITAGVEKLKAAPGATATNSNGGVASVTPTTTSSKGTNAAGPMATQNAVLAGVAAVVGGVLAL